MRGTQFSYTIDVFRGEVLPEGRGGRESCCKRVRLGLLFCHNKVEHLVGTAHSIDDNGKRTGEPAVCSSNSAVEESEGVVFLLSKAARAPNGTEAS